MTYPNLAAILFASLLLVSGAASGQACCAGTAAVAPTRLGRHDDQLVGLQVRGSWVLGSYSRKGVYLPNPAGNQELELGQELFGTLRLLERGQLSLLLPLVETYRATRALSEAGGGMGDIAFSARYDITQAGYRTEVPGIALLAQLTLPTGTAPESSSHPLATDATGMGAWQGGAGLALEQTFGPWLLSLTGLFSLRAARQAAGITSELAPQWTLVAALAHTFDSEAALALYGSYWYEGDATLGGQRAIDSSRSLTQLALAGLLPLGEDFRLHNTLFLNPPLDQLGMNQLSGVGMSVGVAWLSR